MKSARWMDSLRGVRATLALACGGAIAQIAAGAHAEDALFTRPSRPTSAATGGVQFRSPSSPSATGAAAPTSPAPAAVAARPAKPTGTAPAAGNPLRSTNAARVVGSIAARPASAEQAAYTAARPIADAPRPKVVHTTIHKTPAPSFASPDQDLSGLGTTSRSRAIRAASIEPWVGDAAGPAVRQAGFCNCGLGSCPLCGPSCGAYVEPGCGIAEPGCGIAEPGCGIAEPGCGIVEPGCGLEPSCGCDEPECGVPGCGSCVGNPGPDYWCFPVCLPRFKELRVWGGVHGFKGPRDAPAFGGAGDGNFGFQEGVSIGGRAPLVSLLFPQLSYQLGYQAVQSQLSGLSNGDTSDRSQQFVTAGLFRRVGAGLQFGAAFDLLRDDFQAEEDFHQFRYEISLKSRAGHEFGFTGASHLNDATVAGITYQSVDQYLGFVRFHFDGGSNLRFWGGGTNDSEGILGGDFLAPFNNRWALQGGFNYLITDAADGAIGAREESWNVGMNLVWFYGCTAKKGQFNPHAPLFPMADNGYMFIDQKP
jgi:hypothetical protein